MVRLTFRIFPVTRSNVSCLGLATIPSPLRPISSLLALWGSLPSPSPASGLTDTTRSCASTRSLPPSHACSNTTGPSALRVLIEPRAVPCASEQPCSGAGAQGHSAHQGGSGARPRSLTILRHRVTISAWTPLYVSWCCLRCSPRSFAVWRLSTPSRLRQQCSLRSPAAAWSSLRGSREDYGLEYLARLAQPLDRPHALVGS